MWRSLCCDRGVPGALCWFAVVVAASGRLVWGCAVARMGLASRVWSLWAVPYAVCFSSGVFCSASSVFGVSECEIVALLPALCLAGFIGWPSSSPPYGRLVLLMDVLGRGGRLGSVPVVPVALGWHAMLWWCIALLTVGRALAVPGLPLGGACPAGGESLENW